MPVLSWCAQLDTTPFSPNLRPTPGLGSVVRCQQAQFTFTYRIRPSTNNRPRLRYLYESREPGFQSGPENSADSDWMAHCLFVSKSGPPRGRAKKRFFLFSCGVPPPIHFYPRFPKTVSAVKPLQRTSLQIEKKKTKKKHGVSFSMGD